MQTAAASLGHKHEDLDQLLAVVADPQCNPLALSSQLDIATHREWRDYLPETLCDLCGVTAENVAMRDKLMATQVGTVNPDVFEDWSLFTTVNSAFNHRRANFQWLDQPTYIEAAWTCFALRQLQPGVEFKDGVIRFLVALMLEDGLCFFPWTGGPGLALGVNDLDIAAGITDAGELAPKIASLWANGELHDLTLDEKHDETDPLHVQLAKIAAALDYIRAQHSMIPSTYQSRNENNDRVS